MSGITRRFLLAGARLQEFFAEPIERLLPSVVMGQFAASTALGYMGLP